MKHLPKSTLTEILNDPYGFTYKEMSEVNPYGSFNISVSVLLGKCFI